MLRFLSRHSPSAVRVYMIPWEEYKKEKSYSKMIGAISVDIVIIGGGITGILNAYMLAKAGKKVALLEKDELCSYATICTTAFITEVIDTSLSEIARIYDSKTAQLVWQSGMRAIETFEKIIREENIDCEFVRCSNYIFAWTEKQRGELQEEASAYKRLGIAAHFHEDGSKLNFPNYGYIEIPDQAKFHITKFAYALAKKAEKYGALVFEHSEAITIADLTPLVVSTKDGNITAQNVIIATYRPLIKKHTHLKKGMYRSYVFEVEVPKGVFIEALYEDLGNPYHYFRIDRQGAHDRMIIGGEDHKDIFGSALKEKSFESLRLFIKKILAGKDFKIRGKWDGPILEPSDGLPLIGEISPHHFVATGFSGNGMTYSMITALLLRDLIFQKRNEWSTVYDPKRSLLHPKRLVSKASDYIEEFIDGALKNMLS